MEIRPPVLYSDKLIWNKSNKVKLPRIGMKRWIFARVNHQRGGKPFFETKGCKWWVLDWRGGNACCSLGCCVFSLNFARCSQRHFLVVAVAEQSEPLPLPRGPCFLLFCGFLALCSEEPQRQLRIDLWGREAYGGT